MKVTRRTGAGSPSGGVRAALRAVPNGSGGGDKTVSLSFHLSFILSAPGERMTDNYHISR